MISATTKVEMSKATRQKGNSNIRKSGGYSLEGHETQLVSLYRINT